LQTQIAVAPVSGDCPSCAFAQSKIWGSRGGHVILSCVACEMLYFPRPVAHFDYQEYYPYLQYFDAKHFEWEIGIRRRKFRAQLALIRRYMPAARTLLDVGAGPGYFVKVAKELGLDGVGVEPSLAAREAGTREFAVEYVDLEKAADANFDVVTCHHVLEHIEWPQEFLTMLRRKLKSGGLLVLHVPNQQPLSFLVRSMLRGSSSDMPCSLYYPVHINGFTRRSLVRTVERQAFKTIRVIDASMWSMHYDPFFTASYYRRHKFVVATASIVKHAARCLVDVAGSPIGRGDWVIGHFRAI
jgi:SAM-dependent methyltransferase